MATFGIAAIQTAGRKNGNFDLVEREVRSAAKRFPWIDLVTLGELVIHGADTAFAEAPEGPTEQRCAALAKELGIWFQPGSYYEKRDGEIFNVAPVFNPDGEIVAKHDKLFPFLPYEKNVAYGKNYTVFDVPGKGRIGLAICYDMWFPEAIRTLAAMGAEVILLPTMTNTIDRDVELSIARANAAVNQCYFIDVNVAGEQGNGRSVFYGPGGELLHECGTGAEVIPLELDFEQVRRARDRGWHGLGQVMKSFRDAPLAFPMHADAEHRRAALSDLGQLAMPRSGKSNDQNGAGEITGAKPNRKLRVIE
ncbi:carbon-nitrogen hydrolase family protein [Hyphococcus sp. DH-69]|uniref:carbon-nitrogen hydrolase family protein n=1 Tax=Hyphococcus formosus TaxID=3143534 RepID=UPI00398BBA61